MSCDCQDGYTGTYCESDLDACAENSEACYRGVTCLDLPAPANITGYTCGPCPNGYTGDGKSCSGIKNHTTKNIVGYHNIISTKHIWLQSFKY